MIPLDQKSEECLAYQWWNSQISHVNNLNQIPEVVLPNEAHEIWSKICPIFLLFVIDEQDVRTYWESIQTIVNMFLSDQTTVPNPISHFPEFIQIIYTYQDILTPKSVEYCIYFIKKFGFHDSSHFFLYQSPVFFLDPLLYLETLLELRSMQHFLWNDFIKKSFLVDAFFEMYASFLLPISTDSKESAYTHRVLICEVFYSLIQDSFNYHPNFITLINKFLDASINLVSSSSSDLLFPVYRAIFSIFDLIESKNLLPRSDFTSLSHQLFESSSHSLSFYLIFKNLYKKQYITSLQVLNVISQKGITSLTDFAILSEITDQTTVIPLILFLVRSAIRSHLWHRSCFSLLRKILTKIWGTRQDVRDLFHVVIRRLVLWISFASMRRKYGVRQLMLCESLSILSESRVSWLQQSILSSVLSIISASKPAPVYFKSFFQTTGAQVDDVLLHEWDLFSQSAKLKTFPFDSTNGTFIMPPRIEGTSLLRNGCFHRNQTQNQVCQTVINSTASSGFTNQSCTCCITAPNINNFGSSKKIKFYQTEPKKSSVSALSLRQPLNVGDTNGSMRCQSAKGKSKVKSKSSLTPSASYAFGKCHNQIAASKKAAAPVQVVIKRPENACKASKSQPEIMIHSKKKDAFLP